MGSYTVSTSNGTVIAEGGEFLSEESTIFSIPFEQSETHFPTLSPTFSPAMFPAHEMMTQTASSSMAPTECYWLDIVILYDWAPAHISWDLKQIVNFIGDSSEIEVCDEVSWSACSFERSMCLTAGEYEFNIYDSAGNGLCCDWGEGHYNVTSNDVLIVEGGQFGLNETTRFFLPSTSAD